MRILTFMRTLTIMRALRHFLLLGLALGLLGAAGGAAAQTYTYTQIFSDNFNRANTLVGAGANSTNVTGPTGATGQTFAAPATGANYIDVTPGTHWLISGNVATNSGQPTYDPLVRPSSDNILNGRITETKNVNNFAMPLIRWTGTQGYWVLVANTTALYIYSGVPGSGAVVATITGTGFNPNNVGIQAVSNTAHTSTTLYAYTGGVLAGQAVDTTAALQGAGGWGVLGYGTNMTQLTAETVVVVAGITPGTVGPVANGLGNPGNDAPVYNAVTGNFRLALTSTLPGGGNGSYTYQWRQGAASGAEANVTGATAQSAAFAGLTPGATYFFTCVQNDTGNVGAVATAEYSVTLPAAPSYLVYCHGNSITGGVSATTTVSGAGVLGSGNLFGTGWDYPSQLANILGPAFNVVNGGAAGATTEALNNSQADSFYSSAYAKNFCVLWEITNSLNAGDSVPTAEAALNAVLAGRVARGYRVILIGCLPRSGSSDTTFEADRTAVNAYYRANWKALGASAFLDLQQVDARLGFANAYTTSPAYWAGGLHLQNPGYTVIADYVADAITNLLNGGNAGGSAVLRRRIN